MISPNTGQIALGVIGFILAVSSAILLFKASKFNSHRKQLAGLNQARAKEQGLDIRGFDCSSTTSDHDNALATFRDTVPDGDTSSFFRHATILAGKTNTDSAIYILRNSAPETLLEPADLSTLLSASAIVLTQTSGELNSSLLRWVLDAIDKTGSCLERETEWLLCEQLRTRISSLENHQPQNSPMITQLHDWLSKCFGQKLSSPAVRGLLFDLLISVSPRTAERLLSKLHSTDLTVLIQTKSLGHLWELFLGIRSPAGASKLTRTLTEQILVHSSDLDDTSELAFSLIEQMEITIDEIDALSSDLAPTSTDSQIRSILQDACLSLKARVHEVAHSDSDWNPPLFSHELRLAESCA